MVKGKLYTTQKRTGEKVRIVLGPGRHAFDLRDDGEKPVLMGAGEECTVYLSDLEAMPTLGERLDGEGKPTGKAKPTGKPKADKAPEKAPEKVAE